MRPAKRPRLAIQSGHLDCIFLSETLEGQHTCHDAVLLTPTGLLPALIVWAYYRCGGPDTPSYHDALGASPLDWRAVHLIAIALVRLLKKDVCTSAVVALQRYGPEAYTSDAVDDAVMSLLLDWSCMPQEDLTLARRARSGPVWQPLHRKALWRWSLVLFAVVARALWRAFTNYMMRPESGFIRRYMTRRFRANCAAQVCVE